MQLWKQDVATTPSEIEDAIVSRLPYESRYAFVMELNEATRATLDKLYVQERKRLERLAGTPSIVVKAPRGKFSTAERDSIKANGQEPYSILVPLRDYERKPSPTRLLSILKNGYQPQWFFMRPQDMTAKAKMLFDRLLKAFPSFRSVYAAKESMRSDYFECADADTADVIAELAEKLLPDSPAYKFMHDFFGELPQA